MFGSLFDVVANTANIVLTPVKIVANVADKAVVSPLSQLADELAEALRLD